MKGYCTRCKLIGVEMHDEFLCTSCVIEIKKKGSKR